MLLHDTDRTSTGGSWRATLNASDALLNTWLVQGVKVGSLRDRDNASCSSMSAADPSALREPPDNEVCWDQPLGPSRPRPTQQDAA